MRFDPEELEVTLRTALGDAAPSSRRAYALIRRRHEPSRARFELITERAIRRASFTSVTDLRRQIER
jgi:hypothetical protein